MENSEQRRIDLVRQAKRMRSVDTIPLVRTGSKCYNSESVMPQTEDSNGSFVMRIAIAVLGIVCFIWFDTANISCYSMNSQSIVRQIENDSGFSMNVIGDLIK